MIPLTLEERLDLISFLEEQDMQIPLNYQTLIQLGYCFLTDRAKLLYLYMKEIAASNIYNINKPICLTSNEYLVIVTNSSLSTVKSTLSNLIKYELITKTQEGYIVHDPMIESTFIDTINKLIYRKELNSVFSYITSCKNPSNRIEYKNNLKLLTKRAIDDPCLLPIYNLFKEKINDISMI